jgi:hypothetical protein
VRINKRNRRLFRHYLRRKCRKFKNQ